MYIAFLKKESNFFDKLIKFFTKSDYIHCEMVTSKMYSNFYGYTSMPFKGVCSRLVEYNPNDWEFIKITDLRYDVTSLENFYKQTKGKKYDYLGVLGFVLGTKQNPNRYFCSEWCAEYLGFNKPYKFTPYKLYKAIKEHNHEEKNI